MLAALGATTAFLVRDSDGNGSEPASLAENPTLEQASAPSDEVASSQTSRAEPALDGSSTVSRPGDVEETFAAVDLGIDADETIAAVADAMTAADGVERRVIRLPAQGVVLYSVGVDMSRPDAAGVALEGSDYLVSFEVPLSDPPTAAQLGALREVVGRVDVDLGVIDQAIDGEAVTGIEVDGMLICYRVDRSLIVVPEVFGC